MCIDVYYYDGELLRENGLHCSVAVHPLQEVRQQISNQKYFGIIPAEIQRREEPVKCRLSHYSCCNFEVYCSGGDLNALRRFNLCGIHESLRADCNNRSIYMSLQLMCDVNKPIVCLLMVAVVCLTCAMVDLQ